MSHVTPGAATSTAGTLRSPRRDAHSAPRFRALGVDQLDDIAARYGLDASYVERVRAVAAVYPFRVNRYVLDELVDWSAVPEDPIFRLTFPHPAALARPDLERMLALVRSGAPRADLNAAAGEIRLRLNRHQSGERELDSPAGERGLEHKYAETVLFFPAAGQTCHAYCAYCFRWAQFVGDADLRFAEHGPGALTRYLRAHPEVGDVVITGGDPLIMKTAMLERHVAPLLDPALESVRTIRIASKAPAYWPQRFVSDPDADALLRLFERVVASGRQLALMAHYSHPRELSTPPAREAVRRVLATGARIYCQAPLIRGVNDDADVWSELWHDELALGCTPYCMFVERDTGAQWLYELPLVRAHEIFSAAYRTLPGLARTVRGPVMSAAPGEVVVDGTAEIGGEQVLCLRLLQARDPALVGRPFHARLDPDATWLSQLRPAGGEERFVFQ